VTYSDEMFTTIGNCVGHNFFSSAISSLLAFWQLFPLKQSDEPN